MKRIMFVIALLAALPSGHSPPAFWRRNQTLETFSIDSPPSGFVPILNWPRAASIFPERSRPSWMLSSRR